MSPSGGVRSRIAFGLTAAVLVAMLGWLLPKLAGSEEPVLATAEERAFARYARDQVPLIFDNPIQRLFIADVSVEELRELDYGQCDVPFYDLRENHDYEAVVRVVWVYWTDTDRIRVNCDDFERVRRP